MYFKNPNKQRGHLERRAHHEREIDSKRNFELQLQALSLMEYFPTGYRNSFVNSSFRQQFYIYFFFVKCL